MDKIADALDNLMESVEYDGSRMESTLAWRDEVLALASPRCATCKHWDRDMGGVTIEDEWGDCKLLENPYDDRHNEVRVGNPDLAFRLVGGWADCVMIETRIDFGCVLHEPKDGA